MPLPISFVPASSTRPSKAANDLLVQFPEVHDGYDRLGMVHEARGENLQAAECYRKVIAFIKEHPDDYEPGFEDTFVTLVNRLDPPAGCSTHAP
jgi:hypothetical protein